MTTLQIDEQLNTMALHAPRSFGKVSYIVKRVFDDWAIKELAKNGYPNFKMQYMPFLMNIGVGGNTNKEIAVKGRVSKQAMSKVVKELEALQLIKISTSTTDKRSVLIQLTHKGKKMVLVCKTHIIALTNTYKTILGEKNYETMINCLLQIVDYHDGLV